MPKYNCKVGVNHTEAKSIMECRLCGFTSSLEITVKLHMKFVHKEITDGKIFTCGECDKKFDTYKKLSTHFKNHLVRVKSAKF